MVGKTNKKLVPSKAHSYYQKKAVNLGSLSEITSVGRPKNLFTLSKKGFATEEALRASSYTKKRDKPAILSKSINTGKNSIKTFTKNQVYDKVKTTGYKLTF